LIAGSIGIVVTLVLHPNERGMFDPAQVESVALTTIIVHSIALFALPVLFVGGLGISRRIGWDSLGAVTALIFYGFALVAMMNAIVIDGLVTPALARAIVTAGPDQAAAWKVALSHNGFFDAAFMNVFLMASSVAIALWSAAIVHSACGLAIFGWSVALATVACQVTGLLSQHLHLFFLALIGQVIWLVINGARLCQSTAVDS
jgi:hypothetical protein